MYTIGTAGHVDHGKSTLVKALTGIDPDRLPEEKQREMTIDLGFAWARLPSGREVSIVDVPGHERFIRNMLAGVGGIDAALLVVAADEGVMPQTREHLAILDLLGVSSGAVAITKTDLVEDDWLELVDEDIRAEISSTVLSDAPLLHVSAHTGQGLPELMATVDEILSRTPGKVDRGRPRLPIDRVFSLAGFGTVVTGTLLDGSLELGREVEVVPDGPRSRIRGLQTHRHKVERALPGSRTAVNLSGVAVEELRRGQVLTYPGWLKPSCLVDVKLDYLASAPAPLETNDLLEVFTGSAQVQARVRILKGKTLEPGQTGYVQLRLQAPLAVLKGDRFIVRLPSPSITVGGGQVLDPAPRRHRRSEPNLVPLLESLERGSPEELVLQLLGDRLPVEVERIAQRAGLQSGVAAAALEQLVATGQACSLAGYAFSMAAWNRVREASVQALRRYHQQFPLRAGLPREELKSRLELPPRLFNPVLARLAEEGRLVEKRAVLHLPEHQVCFSPEQEAQAARLRQAMAAAPFAPPSIAELERQLKVDAEVIAALVENGTLVKVSEQLVFFREAYEEMVRKVVAHVQANGKITVAEFRDVVGSSRKYALPLLEHLDDLRVTRRVGDERVLGPRAGQHVA